MRQNRFSSIIKRINDISGTFSISAISQLLLSKRIINQILKTEALVHAPLGENINQFSESEIKFVNQLSLDNMDIAKELQTLIDIRYSTLTVMINGRIKKLLFLLASIVVMAIFNFVYSLYAPIFSIGTII